MNKISSEEIWKPVTGREDTHEVSSYGRLRVLEYADKRGRRIKEKIIEPKTFKHGYLIFYLRTGEKSKAGYAYVHKTVANEFIGHKTGERKYVVRHLDGDRKNNRLGNLFWSTKSESFDRQKAMKKFLRKAGEKHQEKFLYDKFEYVNAKTKSVIFCPNHGEFLQSPTKHLSSKHGCPDCWREHRRRKNKPKRKVVLKTRRELIKSFQEKLKKMYGNLDEYSFSYESFSYENREVSCMCPRGHVCTRKADNFRQTKFICTVCAREPSRMSLLKGYDDFKEKAILLHKGRYEYLDENKKDYEDRKSIVAIRCHKHGVYYKTAQKHLAGQGCSICRKEELIEEGVWAGDYREDNLNLDLDSLAHLYYLRVGEVFKIGISKNIKRRIRSISSLAKEKDIEILASVETSLLFCIRAERYILQLFKDFKISKKESGWTSESFRQNIFRDVDDINKELEKIVEHLKEKQDDNT